MSQEISIVLSLLTAGASEKLDEFLGHAKHGLKEFVEAAAEAYISIEGLKKLFELTDEAIKLEEAMGRLSERTGLSIDMLAALKEEASANGVQFDELSTSLGKFSQLVYEAVTQGGKPAEMFERLHISLLETDGALRPLDNILTDVAQRFKEMPAGPQKSAAAVDLLGRAGRQLIPVLNEGAEGIEKLKAAGSPITDESVASATEFEKSLREVREQIEKIFLQIANNLLPWLKQTIEQLKTFGEDSQKVSYIVEGLTDIFKGLVTVGIIVGAAFIDLGKAIGVSVASWVSVFEHAWEIIKTIAANIKQIVEDVLKLNEDLVAGVIAANEAVMLASVGRFSDAKDVASEAIAGMKKDFSSLSEHTGYVFKNVVFNATQAYGEIQGINEDFMVDLITQWNTVGDTLHNLWAKPEKTMPTAPKSSAQAGGIFGPNAEQVKLQAQKNQLTADEFKLNEKLIQQNPFLNDIDKAVELIKIMTEYRALLGNILHDAQATLNSATTEAEKLAANKEILKIKQEIATLDIAEAQQALKLDGIATQFRLVLVQIKNEWKGWSTELAQSFKSVWDSASQSISGSFTQAIMGAKTLNQAVADIGLAIETEIIQSIIKMAVEWVMTHVIMRGAMAVTHAIGVALGWSAAAQTQAQEAAKAPGLAANAATSSVGSYGSSAVVGMVLAIAAIGAIIAAASFRESGGPVSAGRPYIVGERRAELFVPNQSGFILPSVPSAQGAIGGREQAVLNQQSSQNIRMHIVDSVEAAHKRARQDPSMEDWVVDVVNRNVYRISKRA